MSEDRELPQLQGGLAHTGPEVISAPDDAALAAETAELVEVLKVSDHEIGPAWERYQGAVDQLMALVRQEAQSVDPASRAAWIHTRRMWLQAGLINPAHTLQLGVGAARLRREMQPGFVRYARQQPQADEPLAKMVDQYRWELQGMLVRALVERATGTFVNRVPIALIGDYYTRQDEVTNQVKIPLEQLIIEELAVGPIGLPLVEADRDRMSRGRTDRLSTSQLTQQRAVAAELARLKPVIDAVTAASDDPDRFKFLFADPKYSLAIYLRPIPEA